MADNAKKPETTNVKFIKSHPAFAYHTGETGELPKEKATALLKSGHCQAVTPQADEQR
jgi:hypothetical protein